MRFKKPTGTLTIMGNKWKISYENLLEREMLGECRYDERVIAIHNGIKDKDLFNRVVIHEAMHAVFYESGLIHIISSEINEMICFNTERLVEILK